VKKGWLIVLGLALATGLIVFTSQYFSPSAQTVLQPVSNQDIKNNPTENEGSTESTESTENKGSSESKGSTENKPEQEPQSVSQNTSPEKSTTEGLANKKYGWGLKRNDKHETPEMPSSISNLLTKYGAYWIGDTQKKVVYLTFDEGYENGFTPKILDILKEQKVKAAFFITGHYLTSQPELVKRMVQEGHIVGNHTVNHPSLPDISVEEIKKETGQLSEDFFKLTGKKMVYLRPPKGEYSEQTLAVTKDLGYHNIFWSIALVDWIPMPGGPEEAHRSVIDNLHNGAVILLHAVSRDNTDSLEKTIKDTRAQGYEFRTLDDLVKRSS